MSQGISISSSHPKHKPYQRQHAPRHPPTQSFHNHAPFQTDPLPRPPRPSPNRNPRRNSCPRTTQHPDSQLGRRLLTIGLSCKSPTQAAWLAQRAQHRAASNESLLLALPLLHMASRVAPAAGAARSATLVPLCHARCHCRHDGHERLDLHSSPSLHRSAVEGGSAVAITRRVAMDAPGSSGSRTM